jgi:aminopeptidase 2
VYGKDISGMMENWTTKIGFPLITVEETEKGLKIRQNRFLSTADATVSPLCVQ